MQHGLQAHAGAGGESGRVAYRDRRAGAQVAARTACPRRAVAGPGTGAKASVTARAVAKRTRRIHVMVLQRQLLKWLSGATLQFAAAARRALLPRPVDAVSRCNAYAPVLARFRRSSPQNAHAHTGLPTAQHPSPSAMRPDGRIWIEVGRLSCRRGQIAAFQRFHRPLFFRE